MVRRSAIRAPGSGSTARRALPSTPSGDGAPEAHAARIVERIARLLALAESPNQHEAEAATLAAQRLMLKYNLEARTSTQAYGYRHLGKPTGRVGESERILAALLGKHFFVEVIWVPVYRPALGKWGSVLEICGTAENLAMADYVHAYLTHAAEQLWLEHRKALGIASNRDRRTFLSGVMAGFAEKLSRDATHHAKAGLVWVRDGDLEKYLRRRHPHVRNVRYAGTRRNESFAHGRNAGQRIVLRRGIGDGATTPAPLAEGRGGPAPMLPAARRTER